MCKIRFSSFLAIPFAEALMVSAIRPTRTTDSITMPALAPPLNPNYCRAFL